MSSKARKFLFCIAFVIIQGGVSYGGEKDNSPRLIDRSYRSPTTAEVETYRDFFHRLDIEQSILDRFGYRCQAFIDDEHEPERFVSIHAVNRLTDSVRHVVRRSFTDDDDPRLLFSIEDSNGFGDSRTSNGGIFPVEHDRLRKGDSVFLTNNESAQVHRSQISLTSEDRNFDPVTCSLLTVASFFRGDVSKRQLSKVYGIDKLKPKEVSIAGSSFVAMHPVKTTKGPSLMVAFVEFVDELPVTYEIWWTLKDKKKLLFRTATEWETFEEVRLPVRIEALQIHELGNQAFEANLEWRFNEDLPKRLFEVSDVTSRNALDW